jgi:peptide/nickel transport system substrate-binding protein
MKLFNAFLVCGALALGAGPALAQPKGGIVNVATVGEPPTLDPMVSTADLVGIITQHFFETLYTFDKNWKVTPSSPKPCPTSRRTGGSTRSGCARA